jgi:hypothetical protein
MSHVGSCVTSVPAGHVRERNLRQDGAGAAVAAWTVRELKWRSSSRPRPVTEGGELRTVLFDCDDLDALMARWTALGSRGSRTSLLCSSELLGFHVGPRGGADGCTRTPVGGAAWETQAEIAEIRGFLAEGFVHTFKRDYVNVHELRDAESVLAQLAAWIDDAALGARHAEPGRLRGGDVSERRAYAPICLGLWGADHGAVTATGGLAACST